MIVLLIFLQLMPAMRGATSLSRVTFGGYMSFGNDLGFMGNFRIRTSAKSDFGFNATLYFTEKNPFIALQGDLSFLLHRKTRDIPFNFAIAPYFTGGFGDVNYVSFGVNTFFDFPLNLEEGPDFLFYFGLGLGVEVLIYSYKAYTPYPPYYETKTATETSAEGHMSFGTFIHLTKVISLGFEFHFSNDPFGGGYIAGGILFRQ